MHALCVSMNNITLPFLYFNIISVNTVFWRSLYVIQRFLFVWDAMWIKLRCEGRSAFSQELNYISEILRPYVRYFHFVRYNMLILLYPWLVSLHFKNNPYAVLCMPCVDVLVLRQYNKNVTLPLKKRTYYRAYLHVICIAALHTKRRSLGGNSNNIFYSVLLNSFEMWTFVWNVNSILTKYCYVNMHTTVFHPGRSENTETEGVFSDCIFSDASVSFL